MFDIVLNIYNCYSTVINNVYITYNTIVKEVIDRLAPKVRGMQRILYILDIKDRDMRELIVRLS